MKTEFAPKINAHGPTATSDAAHLGTVSIEDAGERRVDVLFYADGRMRFRMVPGNVAIEEAFLNGNPDAIIRVGPRQPITRESTGTS